MLATFRRKIHDFRDDATWPSDGKPAGTVRRVHDRGGAVGGLWVALVLDRATNIDEVVGKHPKSDPTFDADIAAISAAVETMPPLGDADAPLAAGAPFL